MKCFPFFMNLEKKRCLLVGGGAVALRKAQTLASFGAKLFVCAKEVRSELLALGAEQIAKQYDSSLLKGVDFVFAATDDAALNKIVALDCGKAGIPLNCADDKENCDFYFPALLSYGDVSIAISTGGSSPALAAALREWLAQHLPKNLEEIAKEAAALRGSISAQEYVAAVRKMLKEGEKV